VTGGRLQYEGEVLLIGILKEHEAGAKVADLVRRHGMSERSLYRWKSEFGGIEVSEAKRMHAWESEHARLKKLLAEAERDQGDA
jgi:putative transposase